MNTFDFSVLGKAIKKERNKAGLTRDRLAEIVNISPRYLIAIENDGQVPSFHVLYSLVRIFNMSIDQYILDFQAPSSSPTRHNIEVLLNQLDEQDLIIVESTIEGIIKSKTI